MALELESQIAKFNSMHVELEAQYPHQWVIIHNEEFIGVYPTYNEALVKAVEAYGNGPYLLQCLSEEPVYIPAFTLGEVTQ